MGLLCGETPQNIRYGLERSFVIWPTHYNVVVVFAAQAVRVLSCVFWFAKTFHRDIVSSFFHRPNINCIHGVSPFLSLPTYPARRAVWACCVYRSNTVSLCAVVETTAKELCPCASVYRFPVGKLTITVHPLFTDLNTGFGKRLAQLADTGTATGDVNHHGCRLVELALDIPALFDTVGLVLHCPLERTQSALCVVAQQEMQLKSGGVLANVYRHRFMLAVVSNQRLVAGSTLACSVNAPHHIMLTQRPVATRTHAVNGAGTQTLARPQGTDSHIRNTDIHKRMNVLHNKTTFLVALIIPLFSGTVNNFFNSFESLFSCQSPVSGLPCHCIPLTPWIISQRPRRCNRQNAQRLRCDFVQNVKHCC